MEPSLSLTISRKRKMATLQNKSMAYFKTTFFFLARVVADVICRMLLIRQSGLDFWPSIFLIHDKTARYFESLCPLQHLIHRKIWLSLLQFSVVGKMKREKLRRYGHEINHFDLQQAHAYWETDLNDSFSIYLLSRVNKAYES